MTITDCQKQELDDAARRHRTAHVRVKALALLSLGRGASVSETSRLFLVSRQSLYAWQARFLAEGVPGLEVRHGRGRKARADMDEIERHVLQSQENFGLRQTRWTLRALAETVPSLRGFTPSGVERALKRGGFSYKRGQPVQRSPDPEYGKEERA